MTTKTMTGTYASGYVVNMKFNIVSVTSSGTVEGSGLAVEATSATVVNKGNIEGGDTPGYKGVYLFFGGVVENYTQITGYVGVMDAFSGAQLVNSGIVYGFDTAVQFESGGAVLNYATITGGESGVVISGGAGSITNFATISSLDPLQGYSGGEPSVAGVKIATGTVQNLGTIIGPTGVLASSATYVTNYGLIYGFNGVILQSGGTFINVGGYTDTLIHGKYTGVYAVGGTVVNDATITGGTKYGVHLTDGGQLTNGSLIYHAALIEGATGAFINASTASNFGTIIGNMGDGVDIYGTFTNGAPTDTLALIEGYDGLYLELGSAKNFGVIEGVGVKAGSYGIYLADGADLTNGSVNSRAALIEGYGGVTGRSEAGGTVANFGTIEATAAYAAFGANFESGGKVINGSVADITAVLEGPNGVALGSGAILVNFATVSAAAGAGVSSPTGGSVINGGATDTVALILSYYGVSFAAAGSVTNFGTLRSTDPTVASVTDFGGAVTNGTGGDMAALIIGATGVSMSAAGAVTNYATIIGQGGDGVAATGGVITNGGGIDKAALIEGVNGIVTAGTADSIRNFGTVLASGGVGADGVDMTSTGALANGSTSNGVALIEGYDGAVLGDADTGTNFGLIQGAGDAIGVGVLLENGSRMTNGAAGHAGATIEGAVGVATGASAANTVINFGTIIGEAGTAVSLGAVTDDLVVEAGSDFVGSIVGGGGILELGSGTGTLTGLLAGGDVTVSGSMASTTFDDFGAVKIDTGASFALAGTGGTIVAGETLIVAGTLGGSGALTLSGGSAQFDTGADLTIAKVNETVGAAVAGFYATSLTVSDVWTQTAGTVTVATGDKVAFTGTGDVFDGTLTGAGTVDFTGGSDTLSGTHLTATSVVINGASVTLSGSVVLGDTLSVTSPDLTVAAGGATLSGTGSLSLTTTATNEIEGGPLTNASRILGAGLISVTSLVNSGTIQASSTDALTVTTGTTTLVNSGLIESTSTGGLTITGALSNTGSVEAVKGTILVDGSVSGAGTVKLDGGTVDLAGAFSGAVDYLSAGGVLVLAHSKTDTVTVTGFPKTSIGSIDLQDIKFTGATVSFSGTTTSGVLTVKNGANIATITLEGNYTTSTFTLSADSSGGTIVTDPVKTNVGPPPLQPLVSAIASFGAGGAASAAQNHSPEPLRALLAPRA